MAQLKEHGSRSWGPLGKWGSLAFLFLTVLLLYVTVPLARALLVLWVYGVKGYEQGIRVVCLGRQLYFSTGEDVPDGSSTWVALGSFFAAAVVAWGVVYFIVHFVRRCAAHFEKFFGSRARQDVEHMATSHQEGPRHASSTASEVLPFAIYVAAAASVFFVPKIWRSVDFALHEQRTQAIVVRQVTPTGIIYRYTVDGHEYSGAGNLKNAQTCAKGSPVEVRYSSKDPSFSTLGDPLVFPKSVLFMACIIAGFLRIAYLTRKRQQPST